MKRVLYTLQRRGRATRGKVAKVKGSLKDYVREGQCTEQSDLNNPTYFESVFREWNPYGPLPDVDCNPSGPKPLNNPSDLRIYFMIRKNNPHTP